MEKSKRSVFIRNIPNEATEEKLKEIFGEVGPVVSLKLAFGRESGKPKSYGFCEYKDQETALSAINNLNGFEFGGGHTLCVDNVCTEKSRMEMQQLLPRLQYDEQYDNQYEPEIASELITETVASLSPEQMYDLMKQMKTCIQNNSTKARQMLLLNPQIASALLQAQVVMGIVDPQIALSILHKPNQMPTALTSSTMQLPVESASVPIQTVVKPVPPILSLSANRDIDMRDTMYPRLSHNMNQDMIAMPSNSMIKNPIAEQNVQRQPQQRPIAAPIHTVHFSYDPRQRNNDRRNIDEDLRTMPSNPIVEQNVQRQSLQSPVAAPTHTVHFPLYSRQRNNETRNIDEDLRTMPSSPMIQNPIVEQNVQRQPQQRPVAAPTHNIYYPSDPRQRNNDPRVKTQQHRQPVLPMPHTQSNRLAADIPGNASDQERTILIMQVLQLTDEQISMLPPEQQASILVLKEQIAKSSHQD